MPEGDLDLSALTLSGLHMLSPRHQRLVREVYSRIPHVDRVFACRTISIVESPDPTPKGYAHVRREEETETQPWEADFAPEQAWTMTLYPAMLDHLSDAAVRWVIVHEFGHIASGCRTGSVEVGGVTYTQQSPGVYIQAPSKAVHEDSAEVIALSWGFDAECQAWLREDALGS